MICNSPTCAGCYDVEAGVHLHPPRPSPSWVYWKLRAEEMQRRRQRRDAQQRDRKIQETPGGRGPAGNDAHRTGPERLEFN